MLRHGLTLLATVLETTDCDKLEQLVRTGIEKGMHLREGAFFGSWIDDAVSQDNQDTRREHWYSDHDQAQDSRQKISFEGDTLDAPPLAWVHFWKGESSNLFGDWVPKTFQRWGYIMWDAPRLDESGAKEFLDLEDPYRAWDPREEYYQDTSENGD